MLRFHILYMVLYFDHDTTTSVTIEHLEEDRIVVASFDWEIAQPDDTYTIDATHNVSLELDRHFPARLARIMLTDTEHAPSLIALEQLVGEELSSAMQTAPRIGLCSLMLTLTDPQRLAIANLQMSSPSTPPLLRRACRFIMAGATILND